MSAYPYSKFTMTDNLFATFTLISLRKTGKRPEKGQNKETPKTKTLSLAAKNRNYLSPSEGGLAEIDGRIVLFFPNVESIL